MAVARTSSLVFCVASPTKTFVRFAMLLGRVLSLQVEARTDMSVEVTYKTVQEVRRELDDRGISIEAVKRTALVAIPDRFSRMIATNSHSSSTIRDRLLQCGFVTVERSG